MKTIIGVVVFIVAVAVAVYARWFGFKDALSIYPQSDSLKDDDSSDSIDCDG